jgi:uroporphyrinogen decarboxylase
MPQESMTPKERWLAVLQRKKPDRVPMDYWGTDETMEILMRHLGCSEPWDVFRKLHIDHIWAVQPEYVGPAVPADYDVFGCGFRDVSYGLGVYRECVYHPLAQYKTLDELKAGYTWPDPDWWDYSSVPGQLRGKEEYPIHGGGSEPFLIYARMRGMEQAYMDLLLDPEFALYCLDKLFDLAYTETVRIYDQIPGQVTVSYIAEDFGSQVSLLFSPQTIREVFVPRMKRMMDLAHSAGAYVFFHSDGAVRPIIPDMIAAGIDILNPLQWRCRGMEREGLKRDFGDQVVLHGGVDNQHTLAFGSVDDVRAEVLENLAVLGKGGGYILAPCHNIQPISPPENIVAMFETCYAAGWQ